MQIKNGALAILQPPHSVRIVKLVDTTFEAAEAAFEMYTPANAQAVHRWSSAPLPAMP